MKTTILAIFLCCCTFMKAQFGTEKEFFVVAAVLLTRTELTYMNDKAFFSFGPKIPINEENYVSVRCHFKWLDVSGKLIVIPEADYIYKIASFDVPVLSSLQTGIGITPNAVSPKLGVTFLHVLTAEAGHNFEFNEYKHFPTKGFRFSFGLNVIF